MHVPIIIYWTAGVICRGYLDLHDPNRNSARYTHAGTGATLREKWVISANEWLTNPTGPPSLRSEMLPWTPPLQTRTLTTPDTWLCPNLGFVSVIILRSISPQLVLSPYFWVSNTPRYVWFASTCFDTILAPVPFVYCFVWRSIANKGSIHKTCVDTYCWLMRIL